MSLSGSDSGHKRMDEETVPETLKRLGFKVKTIKQNVIGTRAELEEARKTNRCLICDWVGHFESDCDLTAWCPANAEITPHAEIVCMCCGEAVEKNHPNVPLNDIGKRAQLKGSRPQSRRYKA